MKTYFANKRKADYFPKTRKTLEGVDRLDKKSFSDHRFIPFYFISLALITFDKKLIQIIN